MVKGDNYFVHFDKFKHFTRIDTLEPALENLVVTVSPNDNKCLNHLLSGLLEVQNRWSLINTFHKCKHVCITVYSALFLCQRRLRSYDPFVLHTYFYHVSFEFLYIFVHNLV